MSIATGNPVLPAQAPITEEPQITPAEAVEAWLGQQRAGNPNFDLGQMTRQQTLELITNLKQQNRPDNIPGLDRLIESLESNLTRYPANGNMPLARFANDLKLRMAVLETLGEQLPTERATLGDTVNSMQAMATEADLLLQNIFSDPGRWSNDPAALTQQIQSLIDRTETFTSGQASGDTFGLNGLAAELRNALNAYTTAMGRSSEPNSVEASLASSNLRESFHSAKINYLQASGVSGNNAELVGAKAGVRGEQLRQLGLLSPTEDTTATPQAVSVTEIDAALQDLHLQYQLAVAEGNQDAMAHIQAKMEILLPLKDMLLAGDDPLVVGILMFYQLRFVDLSIAKVNQARLRQEAADLQRRNDPNMEEQIADLTSQADAIDATIDALNKQITQVQNQYESVLTMWTQNTNESLSKAF